MNDTPHTPEGRWGWMHHGTWRPLPMEPIRHLGPPPFDVTLPSGEVRHVVVEPRYGDADDVW